MSKITDIPSFEKEMNGEIDSLVEDIEASIDRSLEGDYGLEGSIEATKDNIANAACYLQRAIIASFWTDGGIKNGDGKYVIETERSQQLVMMSAGGSMGSIAESKIIRHFKMPS